MWFFEVDYRYAAIVLILLPIILYGLIYLKNTLVFWFIILTLAFCEGTLDLIGYSSSLNRLTRDMIILFYFILLAVSKNKYFILKYKFIVLALILICVFSKMINETSMIQLLLFLRRILIPILLFWIAFNSRLNFFRNKKFFKYLVFLFTVQIVFAFYKLIIIGFNENYIGSISVRSGSLTTVYVMMGSAVAFLIFLYSKNKKHLLFVAGFVFFGIVGNKRALFFLIPILLLIVFYLYTKLSSKGFTLNFFKRFLLLIGSSFIIMVVISITNPTLNPENKVGGSFDLEFIMDYTDKYNNDDRNGLGRQNAPLLIYNLLAKNGPRSLFWGLGPGDVISSNLITGKNNNLGGDEVVIMEKYNIAYGARTGFLWITMQIGLFGIIIYILFFILISSKIYKELKITNKKLFYLSVFMFLIIFFFDFIFYSPTFTLSNIFTYILFISLGLALKESLRKSVKNNRVPYSSINNIMSL